MTGRTLIGTAGLLVIAVVSIAAQDRDGLTARELFYGMSSSKKPVPAPPATSPSRNPKAGAGVSQQSKGGAAPSKGSAASGKTGPKQDSTVAVAPELNTGSQAIVDVPVLGLRYSVTKRTTAGAFVETDANTTFRSGDGIRVSVEANNDAYLYIVNKGTSGSWSLLFPSPDINDGNNRVRAHQRIEIPAGGQFTFFDQPGEERIFIVLSRPPEADFEQLVSSLNRQDQPKDMAAQTIGDELVGKLRSGVIARDLIFEKVSGGSEASKEQATYIVNVNGSGSSRVVADLSLQHR